MADVPDGVPERAVVVTQHPLPLIEKLNEIYSSNTGLFPLNFSSEWKLNEMYVPKYLLNFRDELSAGYDNSKLVMHGTETERLEEPHM